MLTNQDLQAIQDILNPRFDKLEAEFGQMKKEFQDHKEDFRMFTIQNGGEHTFLYNEIQRLEEKVDNALSRNHADQIDKLDARVSALESTVQTLLSTTA